MSEPRRTWTRRDALRLTAAALAATGLAACDAGGAPTGGAAQGDAPEDAAGTRSFTDSLGREVELPARVERVVASGPVAQEVLLTTVPERLVGLATQLTDAQAAYLGEDVASLPVLGQIYGGKGDFSKEEVAAAAPQLVLDAGEPKDSITEELDGLQEQIGIPFVHLDSTSPESYGDLLDSVADLLSCERASEEADYCRVACDEVAAVMDEVDAEGGRVRAAYLLGADGTNAMARGAFMAGVVDAVTDNVVEVDDPSSSGKGDPVSLEQIAVWDPELIVFSPDGAYETVATDPAWAELAAVKGGNYFLVPAVPYNWLSSPASVNQMLGLRWLARLCYPERFDDDLRDVVGGYYALFYGHDLTDEEFAEVTAGAVRP